jgi:hypothetical protein
LAWAADVRLLKKAGRNAIVIKRESIAGKGLPRYCSMMQMGSEVKVKYASTLFDLNRCFLE